MVDDLDDVSRLIEIHEAQAWSACVAAAANIVGNPLKAEVDNSGNTPYSTLAAFNFAAFNRVIALGVETAATEDDIDALEAFYSARSQSRYRVEVTPTSQPQSLSDSLIRRGLKVTVDRVAKCWRSVQDIPPESPGVAVRELSENDRDQWSQVNIAAWGVPSFFGPWFGATMGCVGFRHFGVFEEDLLVSTGAIYVTGKIAWSGFSATLPNHRGHSYQAATHIKRLQEARAMGCTIVHTETAAKLPGLPNPSLRNQMKVGFTRIYDKYIFSPVSSTTATP